MIEFSVIVHPGSRSPYTSKVYAVDNVRDRFLTVDGDGCFEWVDTDDCMLDEEDDE